MSKILLRLICAGTFVVSFLLALLMSVPRYLNAAYAQELELGSKAYCLIDEKSGEVLLEKDSLRHLPIASVTKTMTLLLIFEAIENGQFGYEDLIYSSKNASGMGGSQVFLDADTDYVANDLLYAIVLSSANDASVAFAEKIAGTEEQFVNLMNKKAQTLGLKNTNFVNCTGLPANNHYSCAYDMAKIMQELVKHEDYFNYTNIRLKDFVHPSGRITQMVNTNKLINSYAGCDAGKTGSTAEAGFCFSSTAQRNGLRLISVVLGAENSKQRFNDAVQLFNYGFNNYESKCIVDVNNPIMLESDIKCAKTKENYVKPSTSFYQTLKKGEESKLAVKNEFYSLTAPLEKGAVVGKIYVLNEDVICAEIDLILCENIDAQTYYDSVKTVLNKW